MPTPSTITNQIEVQDDHHSGLVKTLRFLGHSGPAPEAWQDAAMEIGRALQNEIHISLNLDLKDEQEAALAGLVALHAVRYAIGGGGDGDDLFPEEMMAIQSVVEKSAFGLDELRQKMAALSETQDGWMAIHLEELIGEFIDDPCKSTLQRIRLEGVKAMKAVGVVLF